MEKYKITYQGKEIEIERLSNGKFKIPPLGQFTKHGLGSTWLDEGRIPFNRYDKEEYLPNRVGYKDGLAHMAKRGGGKVQFTSKGNYSTFKSQGRFPANLLTSDNILDYNNSVCINEGNIQTVESDLSKGEVGIGAKVKPLAMPLFTENQEVKKQNSEFPKPSKENLNPQSINSLCQRQDLNLMISEAEKNEGDMLGEEPIIIGERQSLKEITTPAESVDTKGKIAEEGDYTPTTSKPTQNTQNSDLKSLTESPFASPAIAKQKTSDLKDNFSRYFSLDSWWDERIKQLPASVQKTFPFLICPKASKSEKNKNLNSPKKETPFLPSGAFETDNGEKKHTLMRNYHPTVKPLKLMSYLITLGSREGDIVLDPFLGSGTTALACKMLGRKSIGIEINKDYTEIAVKRCSQAAMRLEV